MYGREVYLHKLSSGDTGGKNKVAFLKLLPSIKFLFLKRSLMLPNHSSLTVDELLLLL